MSRAASRCTRFSYAAAAPHKSIRRGRPLYALRVNPSDLRPSSSSAAAHSAARTTSQRPPLPAGRTPYLKDGKDDSASVWLLDGRPHPAHSVGGARRAKSTSLRRPTSATTRRSRISDTLCWERPKSKPHRPLCYLFRVHNLRVLVNVPPNFVRFSWVFPLSNKATFDFASACVASSSTDSASSSFSRSDSALAACPSSPI